MIASVVWIRCSGYEVQQAVGICDRCNFKADVQTRQNSVGNSAYQSAGESKCLTCYLAGTVDTDFFLEFIA